MEPGEPGEWKTAKGYGPQRRQKGALGDAMEGVEVLEPCDMEDMEVCSDAEADAPYEKPKFEKVSAHSGSKKKEIRRIAVPPHRMTPLRNSWKDVLTPLVDHMKLQVRMNTKRRCVEIRVSENTDDPSGSLQKGADFIKGFMMGFEVQDCIALLRMNDIFIEAFQIKDVKRLQGDHLSRAIGRIAGQGGKTKYAIENSTRTRVVIQGDKIHILGSFSNIKLARDALCALILGSEPGKVYNRLKTVSKRVQERL